MKYASAGTRSRYTEPMAVLGCGPIPIPKNLVEFGANAKRSKRKKPLTPVS